MKVAGGLLLIIGIFLLGATFMYNGEQGSDDSSMLSMLIGAGAIVFGIILMFIKPKNKRDKK